METVYEAKCYGCTWHIVSTVLYTVQYAEQHMMETGHIVDVKEVV